VLPQELFLGVVYGERHHFSDRKLPLLAHEKCDAEEGMQRAKALNRTHHNVLANIHQNKVLSWSSM
jgi:hypothetical protein